MTDVLRLLAGVLLNLALRLSRRRVGVAILYHRIDLRQGDPSCEIVPPLERSKFRRQLRHLRRLYKVVPADEFRAAVAARRRGERFPVCLTFDDDLGGHLEHAMPELRGQGVPAMFFLCGAGSSSPWWDRLQRAFDRGCRAADVVELLPAGSGARGRPLGDIHDVADVIHELEPDQREQLAERLLGLAGPDPEGAGLPREGIVALADAGFGIGFHTLRHHRLPELDDTQLARAMNEGRAALEHTIGRPIDAIAYPHGHADPRVATAARQAGFRHGFTSFPYGTTPATPPLLLGRLEPTRLSVGGFGYWVARTLLDRGPQWTGIGQ